MPSYPTPPPDASGGYMHIEYTNGQDTHRMRVHVAPFTSPGSGTPFNYVYSPAVGVVETGVNETFTALINKVKAFYNSSWSFSIADLYQIVAGVPVEQFPPPGASSITGTSATATTGVSRACEAILNTKTTGGRAFRLTMVGGGGFVAEVPVIDTPNPAGTAEQQLIDYLQSANSAVRGHDGNPVQAGSMKVTKPYNRRLRRHYGFS